MKHIDIMRHLPYGKENAITVAELAERSGLSEMDSRSAITAAKMQGKFIFNDGDKFYQPEDEADFWEYAERKPQEIRAMIAFRNRAQYSFHHGKLTIRERSEIAQA